MVIFIIIYQIRKIFRDFRIEFIFEEKLVINFKNIKYSYFINLLLWDEQKI